MPVNESEVLLKLRTHVALLIGVEAEQVAVDRPLHQLGIDSIGFVDLLVFIEKQFQLALTSSGLSQDDFASLTVLTQRIARALSP